MLGLNVPNLLEWIGLQSAGRLIWSSLLLAGGCVIAYRLSGRPKSPEPTTWAQAVLGAVLIFSLMILAYGTVPHEWLNYAGAELNWGEDTYFFRASTVIPFDMSRRAGADTVVAVVYIALLAVQVHLSLRWQRRPVAGSAPAETPADGPPAGGTEPGATPPPRSSRRLSAFGRPLTTRR